MNNEVSKLGEKLFEARCHAIKENLHEKIEKNPFQSLSEAVYEVILNEIIQFNLLPGAKLNEYKLSNVMSVSRTPIREAILLLEKSGFVKRIPGKGAFVTSFSPEDYFKLCDFRFLLEPAAAGFAAINVDENDLKTLKSYSEKLNSSYIEGNIKDVFHFENMFHEHIILCSKNRYIINAYKRIEMKIEQYRLYITGESALFEFLSFEHDYIYTAIALKNQAMAEATMRRHLGLLIPKDKNDVLTANSKIIQRKLDVIEKLKTVL